jgi:hypothetical protein
MESHCEFKRSSSISFHARRTILTKAGEWIGKKIGKVLLVIREK